VLVDVNGIVVLVSNAARRLFNVTLAHVGVPLQDLELSYRPVELRSMIEDAYRQRQVVEQRGVEWAPPDSAPLLLDVLVIPLVDSRGELLGASISFVDVTRYWKLQEELEQSTRELETAYEELQSTNEELETTNEELQSTIEELETTNEELQSTNEELETMNEELHSTNDELQLVNEALQIRSDELDQVHRYFESVLTGLGQGVVVLDRELNVLVWNYWAEDLWGLRSEEVRARHLVNLDIGLPIDQLLPTIRRCLDGVARDGRVTVHARNRRGRDFDCAVQVSALPDEDGHASGVIVLMQEIGGHSEDGEGEPHAD
jgi:two-component system CheB/CheR fusion protein